jgi:hypothetical protein
MAKKAKQEKKQEDPKGDFPEAHKEVNYIYSGPDSYEPRRKQKLTVQEVMTVSPATPEYLKWSEVSITFDHHPLIVCPIVKDVKLNRVLVDSGSSLKILFLKTFDQMGLSRSALCPSQALFHIIVPCAATSPISQITLPVTFGIQENFHTKHLQFEVADFETAYNAFLGRPTLTKFIPIPHYGYLVLKMTGSHDVICVRRDVKRAYDCNRESCETADIVTPHVMKTLIFFVRPLIDH